MVSLSLLGVGPSPSIAGIRFFVSKQKRNVTVDIYLTQDECVEPGVLIRVTF
jgi:hypothetical protein